MQRIHEPERPTLRQTIAWNGRKRRKDLALSQERVGRRMDMSRETVRAIELAENYTVDSLYAYALALEISVKDLVTARYLGQTIRGTLRQPVGLAAVVG